VFLSCQNDTMRVTASKFNRNILLSNISRLFSRYFKIQSKGLKSKEMWSKNLVPAFLSNKTRAALKNRIVNWGGRSTLKWVEKGLFSKSHLYL
jgi:hypothetical protein